MKTKYAACINACVCSYMFFPPLKTAYLYLLFTGNRLNKEPPNLSFRRKDKGGINLTSTVTNTNLDLDTVKAICGEYRIHNADINLRYDATADDLIDVIEGSRVYMPCIYVVNKIDQITLEELEILDKLPHYCPIRYLYFPIQFLLVGGVLIYFILVSILI